MKYFSRLIKELFEFALKEKKYWLLPVFTITLLLWLLVSSAGTSSVPVFVYPMV